MIVKYPFTISQLLVSPTEMVKNNQIISKEIEVTFSHQIEFYQKGSSSMLIKKKCCCLFHAEQKKENQFGTGKKSFLEVLREMCRQNTMRRKQFEKKPLLVCFSNKPALLHP